MKCPYCNKPVREMPPHLEKSEHCRKKHVEKLRDQIKRVVDFYNRARVKE
jgi:hypothetical protein